MAVVTLGSNYNDRVTSTSSVLLGTTPVISGNATLRPVSYFPLAQVVEGSGDGVSDHGALTGLTDDDHDQYALLSGRSGDTLLIDTIDEQTTGSGVNISNININDYTIKPEDGATTNLNLILDSKGTGSVYLGSPDTLSLYVQGGEASILTPAITTGSVSSRQGTIRGISGDAGYPNGSTLTIRGGRANVGSNGTGGNLYLYGGTGYGTGTRGNVYFGDLNDGFLPAKSTETNVVYYETTSGKLSYGTVETGLTSVDIADINATGTADNTTYLRGDGTWSIASAGGVTDHGGLTGLADDDHTQYLNTARGDARYYTETEIDEIIQEVVYLPDSITTNTGTYVSGTVSDVSSLDTSSVYTVDEVGGVPGFNISTAYSSVVSINRIWLHVIYEGSSSHIVNLDLYNYNTTSWDTFTTFTMSDDYQFLDIPIPDDTNYISSGNAQLRIYHMSSGITSHDILIDYMVLAQAGLGSSNVHSSLKGLEDDDHTQYHNDARGDARYYTQTQVDTTFATGAALVAHTSNTSNPHSVQLNDMSDLSISGISQDDILVWNNSLLTWENSTISAAGISEDGHTHPASDITGESWITGITGEPIENLSNVNVTSLGLNEILVYTDPNWVNMTFAEAGITTSSALTSHVNNTSNPHSTVLSSLGDTDISGVAQGNILIWNNSTLNWENETLTTAGIAPSSHTHSAGDITGESWITGISGESLSDLGDVDITSIGLSEILFWNGIDWINRTPTEAGIATISGTAPRNATITSLSTNTTLSSAHNGRIVECTGTIIITLPDGMDTGYQVTIVNYGTGTITINASTTLNTAGAANDLITQYGAASFYHRGSNVWVGFGDLS